MQTDSQRFVFHQRWMLTLVCALGVLLVLGVIRMDNATKPLSNIAKGVRYVADLDSAFDLERVLKDAGIRWEVEASEQLSFGMADYPYWMTFSVPGSNQAEKTLLEVDYALLDSLKVWFVSNGEVIQHYHLGDQFPFAEREILHEKFLIPVPRYPGNLKVVIRMESSGTLRSPIRLWEEDAFMVFNGEHNLVMGLFFGFLTAMALSNLFFFVTTQSMMFLSYCCYVVCFALTLTTLHGLGYKYLWSGSVWLESRSVGIFGVTTLLFAVQFSRQLLNIVDYSRILDKVANVTKWVLLASLVLSFLLPYSMFIKGFIFVLICTVLLIYFVGFFLWYKGVRLARFYTIAWTALLVSGFVTGLDNWDIIQLNTPSQYLLMFGATIETFLLALALALSYSHERQSVYNSQELALQEERLARQSQEEMLRIKEQAQEELEYKVEERTLELEVALRELSETNRELQQRNTTDALTGIRNRHHFDKRYLAEVRRSRREQSQLAIVMLDIDHFKPINDQYGHLVGDECIRQVADILQQNLKRPSDDVCRFGGEEFALILPGTDNEGAMQLVESMRSQIEKTPISTSAGEIHMTISAGIKAATVTSSDDEKGLLEAADEALYQAKDKGRNRIVLANGPKTANTQELS